MTEISICIPLIDSNITYKILSDVFKTYDFGKIKSMRIVDIHANNTRRAFINFSTWNDKYSEVKQKLIENKKIKIMYSFPWYWICSITKSEEESKKYLKNKNNYKENREKKSYRQHINQNKNRKYKDYNYNY